MFTPKFQETNTTDLIPEETHNVTVAANYTTVLNDKTEGVEVISKDVNSTIINAVNTTAETMIVTSASDGNVSDTRETIYPTSFGVWSTLSSSSSSYRMK